MGTRPVNTGGGSATEPLTPMVGDASQGFAIVSHERLDSVEIQPRYRHEKNRQTEPDAHSI